MRRGLALLLLFTLVGFLPTARPAAAGDVDGLPIDLADPDECFVGAPPVPLGLTRGTITSNIAIALDGVSEKTARSLMAKIGTIYAASAAPAPQLAPDVRFKIVAVHDLTKVLKGRDISGFVTAHKPTGTDLMSQLIRYYHTKHPKLKRHQVHLFTNRNIRLPVGGDVGDAAAGIANCLGGIGTKYAYSIGEVGVVGPTEIGPLTAYTNVDTKVSAHEIGHIFGGRHEYMNCVEGIPTALTESTTDFCTLMTNAADFAGDRFGLLEALVVRGFAEKNIAKTYPVPDLPLPELPSVVTAEIPVPIPVP